MKMNGNVTGGASAAERTEEPRRGTSAAERTEESRRGTSAAVRIEELTGRAARILMKCGLPEADALWMAECLVRAESFGITSHGIHLLPIYVRMLKAGSIDISAKLTVCEEGAAYLRLDARNGLGQTVLRDAISMTAKKAKKCGIAVAAGTNSNHFGALASYVGLAAELGMVMLLCCDAPPMIAPSGAKEALFGSNPLLLYAPAGELPPYMLDMATSAQAINKLMIAAKSGREVPLGWGIDRAGRPCTDPAEILESGALLPFGGTKGSGIAGMIQLLCCVLGGKPAGAEPFQRGEPHYGYSFTVILIDSSAFLPRGEYEKRMDAFLSGWLAAAPCDAAEMVRYPGYLAKKRQEAAAAHGIELCEESAEALAEAAELAEEERI